MIGIGALGGARAALRLARRDAWRHKGRSLLIAVMVALPVLAFSVVSVIYRSGQLDPRDQVTMQLGDRAQAVVSIAQYGVPLVQLPDGTYHGIYPPQGAKYPSAPPVAQLEGQVRVALPVGDQLVPDRYSEPEHSLLLGDRAISATVREFDYTAAGVGTLVRQLSGRAPAAPGEVAVSRILARGEGLKVGDRIRNLVEGAPIRQLTVVGVVGGDPLIGEYQVIGPPGSLIPATRGTGARWPGDAENTRWVVTGPVPVDWNNVRTANQHGLVVVSRSVLLDPPAQVQVARDQLRAADHGRAGPGLDSIGITIVVIGLVLLQMALLAGPAIAVGARRSQRTLALVAANGAVPRQLRAIVLGASVVAGVAGCTVAAVLGAGLGVALIPVLRDSRDYPLPRADVQPTDLIALIAVGALTAAAAALIPAGHAARLDVIATLTGRGGQAPPKRRVPVLGLLLVLVGCVVCVYGATGHHLFVTVLGLAMAEIGLIAAIGAIVALISRTGRWLPLAPRFAVRDAARQRGRTAPAIAAVMAAIAGSVAAGIFLASQNAHGRTGYTPVAATGSVVVSFSPGVIGGSGTGTGTTDGKTLQDGTSAQAGLVSALRRTMPIRDVAAFQGTARADGSDIGLILQLPPGRSCPRYRSFVPRPGNGCVPQADDLLPPLHDAPLFDDGRALDALTGEQHPAARMALAAGKVVVFVPELIWPDGTVHVRVANKRVTVVALPAALVPGGLGLAGPVYPPSAARTLGVRISAQGLIASTTRMPSSGEEDRAAAAVRDTFPVNFYLERGYPHSIAIGLLALVVASGLITLVGTLTAVGLAAADGRADVSTLAAVGAAPGVRRRIAAAQAAVIAGVGAALGLAIGLLAGWALVRLTRPGYTLGQMASIGRAGWFGLLGGPRGWSLTVPWIEVLTIVAGVPLVAIVIVFLVTRSRLPLVRRLGQ